MTAKGIVAAVMLAAGTISVGAAGSLLSPDQIKALVANRKPFTAVSRGGMAYWFTLTSRGLVLQDHGGATNM